MKLEIERKFLVPSSSKLPRVRGQVLQQGYLAQGAATVRIRVTDDRAWLTIKGPSVGARKPEYEYPIPRQDALDLLGLEGVFQLSKMRFQVRHGRHIWDVDVYHGPLAGLVTAEVELTREDEAVELPPWVGREVTGERRWDNDMLALQGLPDGAVQ